jgi:hypothetical protein
MARDAAARRPERELPMRPTTLMIAALALAGATALSAAKIDTRYDPKVDFTKFHTFAWKNDKGPLAPDVDSQIRGTAEETLAKKGLARVAAGDKPDLVIVYNAGMSDQLAAGFQLSMDWWGNFVAVPGGDSNMTAGLVFIFYDAASGEAVWGGKLVQGATNENAPVLMRQKAPSFAAKLLKRYPK